MFKPGLKPLILLRYLLFPATIYSWPLGFPSWIRVSSFYWLVSKLIFSFLIVPPLPFKLSLPRSLPMTTCVPFKNFSIGPTASSYANKLPSHLLFGRGCWLITCWPSFFTYIPSLSSPFSAFRIEMNNCLLLCLTPPKFRGFNYPYSGQKGSDSPVSNLKLVQSYCVFL